jgi:hypothetical protein
MARVPSLGVGNALINYDVLKMLEEEDCDPLRVLAKFVSGEIAAPVEARLSAAKELAQYVAPKKRSLDMSAHVKGNVTYNVVNYSEVMPDQAQQLRAMTQELLDQQPLSRDQMKALVRATPMHSATIIEAMREDIERLPSDENGLV